MSVRPKFTTFFRIALLGLVSIHSADAAENPSLLPCLRVLAPPSRLMRAVELSGSPRLNRFLSTAFLRFSADPAVGKLADSIATGSEIEVGEIFQALKGNIVIKRSQATLEIEIPSIQVVTDSMTGTAKEYGKVSDGLNTSFGKLIAALIEGADRIVRIQPNIRKVTLSAPVVNETLAKMLLDFGFETPLYGRLITREEVHALLVSKTIPPTLGDVLERLRGTHPEFEGKLRQTRDSNEPFAGKYSPSIPFVLDLPVP